MKLCEYIDNCLNDLGIEKVFGIPGSLVMPIWQSITQAEIILCSNEQEATYVACGYAKMTQKPVAVITTGGPGVTNGISGIASANIDSLPLIFISGKTPIDKCGKGVLQEESNFNRHFDSVRITSEITKFSHTICRNDLKKNTIFSYLHRAIENRCGPIHISVPVDLQNEEIKSGFLESNKEDINEFDLPKKIFGNTLIIIGWGAWMSQSHKLIYDYASRINAPVLVTSKAYCCADYYHPNYLGKLGYGYFEHIDSFIKNNNFNNVIVFGSSLNEYDISQSYIRRMFDKCTFYFVTNDVSSINSSGNSNHLIYTNDMKKYIEALIENTEIIEQNKKLINQIKIVKLKGNAYWQNRLKNDDDMSKAILALNKVKRHFVVTADAGNHLLATATLYNQVHTGELFIDFGIRAMGYGICSTVGMAFGDKSKVYLAITGDGCMLMNGNVMHLAKKYHLPIIFLVFNNKSLGRVRVGQSMMNDYRASDILDVDFASYANTFGLDSYSFSSIEEFESKIESIIKKKQPAIVEFTTNRDEVPVFIKDSIY